MPASRSVSSFELKKVEEGRFSLRGEMSFGNAEQILAASERVFQSSTSLELDLSDVDDADSAGLALLLEWKARAQRQAAEIRFVNVPESLLAIAKTTDVSDLIR